METTYTPGCFTISSEKNTAAITISPNDHPGVIRAVSDLRSDIKRVTGRTPDMVDDVRFCNGDVIIPGTIGRNDVIDTLIKEGKVDASRIEGQWESYLIQVVRDALPGIRNALVIAGSDKRGTIFGIYELSSRMGVSPWYWWADVPVEHRESIHMKPETIEKGPPSVKYRGIFLNDEWPALTNWIIEKYGTVPLREDPPTHEGIGNYGRDFYTRLFELILRLKGNYLWPAMWNNAFSEDDPENPRLADEYGIVMGNSHQEPMLRAQKEWDRRYLSTLGHWNYEKHPEVLEHFWREGIRRNRNRESIVTIGLRGADDTEMAPGGTEANMRLLEKIVDTQRRIISEEMNTSPEKIPQLWCLYKEVQDFYKAGMRVPDDVILLWAEDNWGNIRRLPTPEERKRTGGAGIYYHFDYHGGPRSYQWINTNPIAKIWDQMMLAKQYGADKVWIVNVGHFKGYEFPMEYFLDLAWDTEKWTNDNLGEYTRLWAERQFGGIYASEIAEIITQYTRFNGRRKPELLRPGTYSLVNYREAEQVVEDYTTLSEKAEELYGKIPVEYRDAFYQLVLFPVKACALVNALYVAAGKNELYARQGRASTIQAAAETRTLFTMDLELMKHYNTEFAGGKWAHFMDQTHLGYTDWNDPPANTLDAIHLVEIDVQEEASLGVAVEGSEAAWPHAGESPVLPVADSLNRQRRYIEVFNKGSTPFVAEIHADVPWIGVSETHVLIGGDARIWIDIDWTMVRPGAASGSVTVNGAGNSVTVGVKAVNPIEPTRETLRGFAEGDGYVSIEAEHVSRKYGSGQLEWIRIENYGRTLSGMRASGPAGMTPVIPGKNAPCLEYDMYLFTKGVVSVLLTLSPTLNFIEGRPLRYAVSFDSGEPETITAVPADFNAMNGNRDWEKTVSDNARITVSNHTIEESGYHTLKIWMVDPGVAVQKIVVDTGGVRPSYLGPPESFHA